MIDVHCHILPALDDGALDLDDSVAMARQADADGIELICATPHVRHDHAVVLEELAARVALLNDELENRGVAARVLQGGEVAETTAGKLSADELGLASIGRGLRWILLEPRPGPLSKSLAATVELLLERGFRSLIAHPERHLGAGSVEWLAEVVRSGALVQATAAHIAEPGPNPTLRLAARGLVHVLGSDSHSARAGRPVKLSDGVARLRGISTLAPHVDWIAQIAPAAIVRGDDLEAPFPLASGASSLVTDSGPGE